MSDLAAWLEQAGLEHLAASLAEHDVDLAILADLGDADLEKIGLSLGNRRKLLRAVAADPALARTVRAPAAASAAERRQLTVLFCDLVESSALAAALDPEELQVLINDYWSLCKERVSQHNGVVARHMGDGLLVYFGYPVADEHSVERAIKAGLAIVRDIGELRSRPQRTVAVRVGIATGEVVIGDLVRTGDAAEIAAYGPAPFLAARLQSVARPNSVLIDDNAHRIAGGLFEYETPQLRTLKGFGDNVQVWPVRGESSADSRFEAIHPANDRAPLVGRDTERAYLLEMWERARGGEGVVVLVEGEAGIGKSRLVQSVYEVVERDRVALMSASPHTTNTPWAPLRSLAERVAGFVADDPASVRIDKLRELVARMTGCETTSVEAAALEALALLVGIESAAAQAARRSPEMVKQHALEVMESLFVALARQPLLAVVEDLHWLDPSTMDLVTRLVERVAGLPVLVLMSHRPEFEPMWREHGWVRRLVVNRLPDSEAGKIVRHLTHGAKLAPELRARIIERADGVPLFAEELAKAIVTSTAGGGDGSTVAIPETLQDSLMARLESAGNIKRVAQIAAVIGREFDPALLAAVTADDATDVHAALEELLAHNVVRRSGHGRLEVFSFRHALLHDAIYNSILRPRRSALHQQVGATLERRFGDVARTAPEILAHHFSAAGERERALDYWRQAGERSTAAAAHTEAVKYFDLALALVADVADSAARDEAELGLLVGRGLSLSSIMGYAAPDVEETYRRARVLCNRLEASVARFPIVLGLWRFYLVRDELDTSRNLAQQCYALAEQSGEPSYLVEAHTALAFTVAYQGDLKRAREHLAAAIAAYEGLAPGTFVQVTPQDPAVACYGLLAMVECLRGSLEQARRAAADGLALARRLNQPFSTAFVMVYAAMVYQLLGDCRRAAELGEEAAALAREFGLYMFEVLGNIHVGIARGSSTPASADIDALDSGIATWRAIGGECFCPYFHAGKALVCLRVGEIERGLAATDEGLSHAERHDERFCDSLLLWLRGELLGAGPTPRSDDATEALRRAVTVARRQGARWAEFNALLAGARLDAAPARRRHLADALMLIEGGEDCPPVREAEALLAADG